MKTKAEQWLIFISVGLVLAFTFYFPLIIVPQTSQAYPGEGEVNTPGYPPPQITLTPSTTPRPAKAGVTPTWVPPTPIPTTILSTPDNPRKGVAASLGDGWGNTIRPTIGTWAYYWTGIAPLGTQYGVQYIPLVAGNLSAPLDPITLQGYYNNSGGHHYWLVFNECENNYQCNTTPLQAATFFKEEVIEAISAIDPAPKFIVGGVNAHACGVRWLKDFVIEYTIRYDEPPPVAGWHFHLYPNVYPKDWQPSDVNCLYSPTEFENGANYHGWDWWGADSDGSLHNWRLLDWERDMINIYNFIYTYSQADHEVWITEMGCIGTALWYPPAPTPGPVYCGANDFLNNYVAGITNWLNTEGRWVTRYAWYGDYDGTHIDSSMLRSGNPPADWTSLGLYYARVTPQSIQPLPQVTPQLYLPVVPQP